MARITNVMSVRTADIGNFLFAALLTHQLFAATEIQQFPSAYPAVFAVISLMLTSIIFRSSTAFQGRTIYYHNFRHLKYHLGIFLFVVFIPLSGTIFLMFISSTFGFTLTYYHFRQTMSPHPVPFRYVFVLLFS